jgi:hypothetical protein
VQHHEIPIRQDQLIFVLQRRRCILTTLSVSSPTESHYRHETKQQRKEC